MSTPNLSSIPGISQPSSRTRALLIPSSSKYPWVCQTGAHEHDFSPNASLVLPSPRRTYVVPSVAIRNPEPRNLHDDSESSSGTPTEEKKPKAMKLDSLQSSRTGAIWNRPMLRSQHIRAFHHDQPYPRQVSPTSKPHTLPLELPHPTSPTHRKVARRRNWLRAFVASFQRSRLVSHPLTYLALYFAFNLTLTLYNKSLLINFPFPYTLSAVHALCGSIGSLILVRTGSVPVPRLNALETLILLAFSGLYTVNIIVSNVSLGLVTVPFHQVVRASTPLFTILLSALILGTRSRRAKVLALVPVVAGVGLATYGDYYFTPWGFFLTLLGTVLASLKTIYTNFLQTPPHVTSRPHPHSHIANGSPFYAADKTTVPNTVSPPTPPSSRTRLPPLSPLHLLSLLSPLAFIQTTLIAHFSGELERAWASLGLQHLPTSGLMRRQPPSGPALSNVRLVLLLMNGLMAFGLNVVSFTANRKVGALSMTVAGNVKQVLTILSAVVLFDLTITPMNAVGITLTLVGGVVYTAVELKERHERAISSL
ncbi:putative triose-phosphate Transporter family protein [Lyophyllum shimeji]|uniref:Triose-phosphate Transporter family protein n=1 Tax=Lyophyllum shimeji TaxID=47721 RepID=A0A9P3UM06_LYOSH|nr:putative triose-phosphate Transporter family protein [Lyophyllum shimeji]